MGSKDSWATFFQALHDVENHISTSDHRFELATEELEKLVSSVEHHVSDGLQVEPCGTKFYHPHRFGPVWTELQKLEQEHRVYIECNPDNRVAIYPCAAVTVTNRRTHATVKVICWFALSADREAKEWYEGLLEDHHETHADALMKTPYFVVEGISSIITSTPDTICSFILDVLQEKK